MMKEFRLTEGAHVSITMPAYPHPQVLFGVTIFAMLQTRAHGLILCTAVIHCGMAGGVEQQTAAALETALCDFFKSLDASTNNDIELRVCRDQGHHDEDILIEAIEIYVQ